MRPQRDDIAAPELPGRVRWHNGDPGPMSELTARGPVLVHFFDLAQLNSIRALPYQRAWAERYGPAGLTVLGVHSPRFPFTAAADALGAALARLGLEHPVAADSDYSIWHDYGCKGWPSLFLWGRGGALRWHHFGEGEYAATEEAIQGELRAAGHEGELPEPMAPLRPSDAPGARVRPPSEEVFPGGSAAQPWAPAASGERIVVRYAAGGAYASVDGGGDLLVAVDGGEARRLEVSSPGLVELASHPRHERHELELEAGAGVRVWSVSFAAGLP